VAAVGCFVAFEVVAGAAFLFWGRRLWFQNDDWDFLVSRRAGNLHSLFSPHTGHWVTLPILVYRLWWSIFGLRDFVAYQVLIVGLHLVAAGLLRVVMRRAGVRPWLATLAAAAFVCFGAGYENILRPFQITLVGSLVFGLAHLLVVDRDGPLDRRDLLGMSFGLAGLLCSGVGVVMVVTVGAVVVLRRGWRVALVQTVPLALIYTVWWFAIGHTQSLPSRGVGEAIRFAWRMVTASIAAAGQVSGLGVVLAAILVIGFVLAARRAGARQLRSTMAAPFSLVGGSFVFVALTATTRAGTFLPNASRYLYLVVAFALPAFGVAIETIMRSRRWLVVPISAIVLVAAVGNVRALVDYTHSPAVQYEPAFRRMVLTAPLAHVAKQVPPKARFESGGAGAARITIGWLLDNVASKHIPKLHHVNAADLAMDTVRLSLAPNRPVLAGKVCRPVLRGLLVHLPQGAELIVRDRGRVAARIIPADQPRGGAFPLSVPARSTVGYTARVSIDLRVVPDITRPQRTSIQLCSAQTVISSEIARAVRP